jgi:sortase A
VRDTPLPGQAGWSLIYGKAATFGSPFRQTDRLRPGDRINVTTGEDTFTYRVSGVRRQGDPVPTTLAANAGRLTLETADSANPLQFGHTVYVDADLLGTPAQTPAGRPTLIPPEEGPMMSDANANVALVLWLQALGVLLGATVWARRAWGRREALLIGTPLILAVMWNIYDTVGHLLPNLL